MERTGFRQGLDEREPKAAIARLSSVRGSRPEGLAHEVADGESKGMLGEARSHSWFENTIFVVVADHCASSAGRVGLPVHKYHTPLLIHAPGHIKAREVKTLCSQVGVAPTLLGLLGLSCTSRFFGQDALQPDFQGRAFIGNYQRLGLLDHDGLAILSPQQEIQVMDSPFGEQTIRSGSTDEPLVMRAQAADQAADHVIRTRMNRW